MSVTLPPIRLGRDELIAALEARRKWAERFDAKNLAQHEKKEADALKRFRAACLAASKWDYETAKDHSFYVERSHYGSSCPDSAVVRLDEMLKLVRLSQQATYTVSNDGPTSRLFWLLTHDESVKRDLCS